MRILLLSLCIALVAACRLPACADDAPAAPPPEEATRPHIAADGYSVEADYIQGEAGGDILAEGSVRLVSPDGVFTTDRARYNFQTCTGHLENAAGVIDPFRFTAHSIAIDEQHSKHIHGVLLTTCTHEHPHYALLVKDLLVSADERVHAKRVSLTLHGKKLITLPGLRGSLRDDEEGVFAPTIVAGVSGLDGVYLGANIHSPVGQSADLLVTGRFGTRGVLRGGLHLTRPFALGETARGQVALVATHREDIDNSLLGAETVEGVRLKELTVSRLPAVQVTLDPVALPAPLAGATLRAGGGYGRYLERPTGVTEERGQVWASVQSPTATVGPVRLYGQYGLRKAFYPGESHQASVLQLTAETDPKGDRYYHVSYLHREEHGTSPFLFDRVLVPRELYSEVEVPLTKTGTWRMGVQTRYDLDEGRFRNYAVSAIYRLDCLSYAVSYDHAARAFGVGMVINAFGSFRRGASTINFGQ